MALAPSSPDAPLGARTQMAHDSKICGQRWREGRVSSAKSRRRATNGDTAKVFFQTYDKTKSSFLPMSCVSARCNVLKRWRIEPPQRRRFCNTFGCRLSDLMPIFLCVDGDS